MSRPGDGGIQDDDRRISGMKDKKFQAGPPAYAALRPRPTRSRRGQARRAPALTPSRVAIVIAAAHDARLKVSPVGKAAIVPDHRSLKPESRAQSRAREKWRHPLRRAPRVSSGIGQQLAIAPEERLMASAQR